MKDGQNSEERTLSNDGWVFRIGFLIMLLAASISIATLCLHDSSAALMLALPAVGWFYYFYFCRKVVDCRYDDSKIRFMAWGKKLELQWAEIQRVKLVELTRGAYLRIDLKNPSAFGAKLYVNLPFFARYRNEALKVLERHIKIDQ